MRRSTLLAPLAAFCALGPISEARAAPEVETSTSTPSLDEDAVRQRLRARILKDLVEELRREVKEDIKNDIQAEQVESGFDDGELEDAGWGDEDWKWEEPLEPQQRFLELDGYFRARYDLFNRLDLQTYYLNSVTGQESGPFAQEYVVDPATNIGQYRRVQAPPVPSCDSDVRERPNDDNNNMPLARSCALDAGTSDTLGGANLRLRLEPVLNVYEDMKVKMQIDVLDNLVLGSTSDALAINPWAPISVLSNGQIPPSDGQNSVWTDSIRVKRLWAEIMTPLGQVRVGRMPAHFGLGVMANEGRGIDSDFGDSVDRIMFATQIGDFLIMPGFDWAVSNPTTANRFTPYGQPLDWDQRDDVDDYFIAFVKQDSPQDIRQKLDNNELVLNYGTYQMGRFQALDAQTPLRLGLDNIAPDTQRDAQIYMYSYWLEVRYQNIIFDAEYSGIIGSIGYANDLPNGAGAQTVTQDSLRINQHGAVARLQYRLFDDVLTLRAMLVMASGDSAPGWGVRPLMRTDGSTNVWDGHQAGTSGDRSLTNYRFSPDFIVDMILWRQLVGTVTDALIFRPGAVVRTNSGIGASLDVIYSRALLSASTPSASFAQPSNGTALGQADANLGLEGNLKLFYETDDGFHFWFQYGLLIPFGGLDREVVIEPGSPIGLDQGDRREDDDGITFARLSASLAHTFQLMLAVSF